MEDAYSVRRAAPADMEAVNSLALAEGWNDTPEYLQTCLHAHPPGYWVAHTAHGHVISHCGANVIDDDNGFVNVYVTDRAWRGRGIGRQLYEQSVQSLGHRNIGINANWDRTAMYKSAGFDVSSFKLMVYQCSMEHITVSPQPLRTASIRALTEVSLDKILEYDLKLSTFSATRGEGPSAGRGEGPSAGRGEGPSTGEGEVLTASALRREVLARCVQNSLEGLVVVEGGQVVGWCSLSKADLAYCLMPVYADTPAVAEALIHRALSHVPRHARVEVSYPATNLAAQRIYEGIGLTKGLTDHNMRMYTKKDVPLPLNKVFSLSNYHLALF